MNNHIRDGLEIGTQLNNYIIEAILGQGAFGITYLAHDKNLNCLVAIKEYLPRELVIRDKDMTVSPFSVTKSTQFNYGLDSFLREAQTIAKFKHPNIVRILTFFRKNNTAYIVMEYEKGQTLKSYVEEKNNLSEQRLLDIFCPINDGLLLMHQKGYIHRDIKPDNIVIRDDHTPVLIDFGTARDTLNSNSSDLTQVFTRGYAPFEQCHPTWAEQGPWTDIYSLGATLYFAITGKRIIASDMRMVNDPYQPLLCADDKAYSEHFLKAVDDALSFQPNKRPKNLKEWNQALIASHNLQKWNQTLENTYLKKEKVTQSRINSEYHTTQHKNTKRNKDNRHTSNTNLKYSDRTKLYGEHVLDENFNIVKSNKRSTKIKVFYAILIFICIALILLSYYFFAISDKIPKRIPHPIPIISTLPHLRDSNLSKEIQQGIEDLIAKSNEKLASNLLDFPSNINICNDINKFINKYPYKELREIYLMSLEKSLDFIPKLGHKDIHNEWLKIHEKSIRKDASGQYLVKYSFKEIILKDINLYGKLTIESPNIILNVEMSGDNFKCTHNNLCKTPLVISKIHSGEEMIKLSNDNKGVDVDNTINIHPQQEYLLYIE